ncbi:hypothetical protein AB0K09_05850 [Streptomyces sp. NPDC049577]|uniref:hypothetical protein n=1 Tax=Streptomyces sp. NPDC049577 TaxID=3155153 RepID=UPI00343AD5BB
MPVPLAARRVVVWQQAHASSSTRRTTPAAAECAPTAGRVWSTAFRAHEQARAGNEEVA